MNTSRFQALFTKSQTEKLSKSEIKELNSLISLHPELEKDAEFIASFWSESEFTIKGDGSRVFEEISKEINSNSIIPMYSNQKPARKIFFTPYRIAAAIVFFLVAGFMAGFILQQIPADNDDVLAETIVKQIEKNVMIGNKLRVFLPDGSIVWLNSESKLSYPERFSDHVRIVQLEGEAFFEVTKNPTKAFIVKSGALTTTALGTSFNVRGYSFEKDIQVTLVTGKVLVEKEDQKFILEPGFGVQYSKEDGTIMKEKRSVNKIIGWKDGIIQFENDTYQTVAKKLSRWYGVEFVLVEPYNGEGWRYSGWFKNDYLDNVLKSISFSQDFDYKIENEKVIITKKK